MRSCRVLFALACGAVVAALLGGGRTASAGPILYATTGDTESQLFLIDPMTMTTTLVGNTGLNRVGGLAFDSFGVLYGVTGGGMGPAELYTIDPLTAIPTLVGAIAGIDAVEGLAFDSSGTLWAGGFVGPPPLGGSGRLLTLDKTDGHIIDNFAMVGSGSRFTSGLAFDSSDQLFGSRGNSFGHLEDIVRIDTTTDPAVQTAVGGATRIISDIWFDSTGTLYAVSPQTPGEGLFTIDPTTGAKTLVFETTGLRFSSLTGLDAPLAPVPEPTTLLLLSSGFAMLVGVRRKRS